jgi:hypothetical protein
LSIFVFGYSFPVGGANGEYQGALSVWKRAGIMPTLVPTWLPDEDEHRKMNRLGYRTIVVPKECPKGIPDIPGIRNSTVVAFCNGIVLVHDTYKCLKGLGVKLVHVPTMLWAAPLEAEAFNVNGLPERFVFQTEKQRTAYTTSLCGLSRFTPEQIAERSRVIPAAFDFEAWEYAPRPHQKPHPFVIGKVARPDPAKWRTDHWAVLARVPYNARMAIVMGVNPAVIKFDPPKPEWADWIKPNGVPIRKYYGMIHAMAPLNPAQTDENFPRVTLECYATGTSLVAPNNSGWVDQVDHGRTGYLANDDDEAAYWLGSLIHDPERRTKMIVAGMEFLRDELCAESKIIPKWLALFAEME